MRKSIFLFPILVLLTLHAFGQCATVDYNKDKGPSHLDGINQFEEWIKERIRGERKFLIQESVYTIPVVFHIIHNGELKGEGINISEERIRQQMKTLNEDFQRKNADTTNTPREFQAVAGGMSLEFVLAKQDPEGMPSNGIVRINGRKSEWEYTDPDSDTNIKSLSYWPAEDYFNIWITNIVYKGLADDRKLVGYAQFPQSDLIRGIRIPPFDAKTDGVVMLYQAIGADRYQRVLTHEVGHFLGLRHIWGDINLCDNEGDYVDDTPQQSDATQSSCPTHPFSDCEGFRMFQNYMDYTTDECKNMFTQQQIQRMRIVINNSPQRKSLLTSKGAIEPVLAANDLRLHKVISPQENTCDLALNPQINVRNYGSNAISSAHIEMRLNGEVMQVKKVDFDPVLSPFEIDTLSYDEVTLTTTGENTFAFTILQVNDTTDGEFKNDTISKKTTTPERAMIPFREAFDDGLTKWSVQNPDQLITWVDKENENDGFINHSAYINFYKYTKTKSPDRLISPILTFPSSSSALSNQVMIKFDWFYSTPTNGVSDTLRVALISDCNVNLAEGFELFNKSGREMATIPVLSEGQLTPSSIAQWKTFAIALDPARIINASKPQIIFEGTSGYGEDLYIDNVSVSHPPHLNTLYRVYSDPTLKDIRVTFNLEQRESVRLQVYSMMGQPISNHILYNALDQTYIIPMENRDDGIYILRMQFKDRVEATRIFVNP